MMLKKVTFSKRRISWIKWCIFIVSFFVLVNCSSSIFFHHSYREWIQGDPISPYLFVIVMEALNCFLKRAKVEGFLLG